jgi:hypothetical protein
VTRTRLLALPVLLCAAAASTDCGSTPPAPTQQPATSEPEAPPNPEATPKSKAKAGEAKADEATPKPKAKADEATPKPKAKAGAAEPAQPEEDIAGDLRRRVPDSGRHCVQSLKQRFYPCYVLLFHFTDPAVEARIEDELFEIWNRVDPLVGKGFDQGREVDPAEVERVRAKAEKRIRKVLGRQASENLTRVELEVFVEDAYEEPPEL